MNFAQNRFWREISKGVDPWGGTEPDRRSQLNVGPLAEDSTRWSDPVWREVSLW